MPTRREVYAEMKGQGFDVKVFKVAYRRYRAHADDATTAQEGEALADLFWGATARKASQRATSRQQTAIPSCAHTREEYDPKQAKSKTPNPEAVQVRPLPPARRGSRRNRRPAVTETPPPAVPRTLRLPRRTMLPPFIVRHPFN